MPSLTSLQQESILCCVKKMLGLDADYDAFDTDVIVCINSALMTCMQLGVGPKEGFTVTGNSETWDDFLEDDLVQLQAVKQFVYLKVKQTFDPPESSFVNASIDRAVDELTWRLNVQAEDG